MKEEVGVWGKVPDVKSPKNNRTIESVYTANVDADPEGLVKPRSTARSCHVRRTLWLKKHNVRCDYVVGVLVFVLGRCLQ
jgi:hypothetical protein